jgi:energy-converting hydrogenase Eha subunit E
VKSILEKLGQDPQRSLVLFTRGLGLFVIGVCLIFIGYYHHYSWQIAGLTFLAFAIIFAVWGYSGIFANRVLNIFDRHTNKDN